MPEKPEKQIPWATKGTVVEYAGDNYVVLKRPPVEVTVYGDGSSYSISLDSKQVITDFMKKDRQLTENVQNFFEAFREAHRTSTYQERMKAWIRGDDPHTAMKRQRTLDWHPSAEVRPPFETGDYGGGNTTNFGDRWIGDVFEYRHFWTSEGKEGAVIIWHGGGDVRGNYGEPEVWLGNFSDFMQQQEEYERRSPDTFMHYNEILENGILWALDLMGHFDRPEELGDLAIAAISQDPDLLWPEAVAKLEDALGSSHEMEPNLLRVLSKAVRTWRTRRAREAEKAAGQRYFWPRAMKEPKK